MKSKEILSQNQEETNQEKQDLFKLSTLTLIIMIILSLLYTG